MADVEDANRELGVPGFVTESEQELWANEAKAFA